MVDLRAELRPLVDEPARPPLPITEVAARARRRRQRKRGAGAAAIAAAFVGSVGLVVALVAQGPNGQVTTADEPDRAPTRSTTVPAQGPTITAPSPTTSVPPPVSATDPEPEAEADTGVVASPGVTATAATTSAWENGSCVEVRLTNTTAAAVDWEVLTTPAGRITTVWNATTQAAADGRTAFHGDEWNRRLQPGLDTTFGYCIGT